MLYPLIAARLHGWLDDLVVLAYIVGAFLLDLSGPALWLIAGAALTHFLLARATAYPQGQIALISFKAHAHIELAEGALVLAGAAVIDMSPVQQGFVVLMGLSQAVAFSFSDYEWPKAVSPTRA